MSACRRRRGRVLLGAVAVAVMAVTGCGGGGDEDGEVASAQGSKVNANASKQASSELSEYVEARRTWVKCLRDNGIDAPDPNARGEVDLADVVRSKQDPTFGRAQDRCGDLLPPVPESVEKGNQPELPKAEIAMKQEYSKCMQENGAPDFPDTDETGYYRDVPWDSASAGAQRASRECAPIIGIPTDAPEPKG